MDSKLKNVMIIRKSGTRHAFTIIDRTAFEDERLSAEAKGIYGYLVVKPDDWRISMADIQKRCNVGRDKLRRIFAELQEYGYADLVPRRDKAGKVFGKEWILYEVPSLNNRQPENPSFGDSTDRLKKPTSVKTDGRKIRGYTNNTVLPNTKEEELNTQRHAPGEIELHDFVQAWGLKRTSYRMETAWMQLLPQEKAEIAKHLPKYLKASGEYKGKPETYLKNKKWTEEIYTPSNGTKREGGGGGPAIEYKRSFNHK